MFERKTSYLDKLVPDLKERGYTGYAVNSAKKKSAVYSVVVTFTGEGKEDVQKAGIQYADDFHELKEKLSKSGLQDKPYTGPHKLLNNRVVLLKSAGYRDYEFSRKVQGDSVHVEIEFFGKDKKAEKESVSYQTAAQFNALSSILGKLNGKPLDDMKYYNLEDKISEIKGPYTHYKIGDVAEAGAVNNRDISIIFTGKDVERITHASTYDNAEEYSKFVRVLKHSGLEKGMAKSKKMTELESKIIEIKHKGYDGYKVYIIPTKDKNWSKMRINFFIGNDKKSLLPYDSSFTEREEDKMFRDILKESKMANMDRGSVIGQIKHARSVNNPKAKEVVFGE